MNDNNTSLEQDLLLDNGLFHRDSETLLGDADRDGDLDIDDVSLIVSARNTPVTEANSILDVDGDGLISVLDARQIIVQLQENTDTNAPELSIGLRRDTAPNGAIDNDGITRNIGIQGVIADESPIASLKVGFDDTPLEDYINIVGIVNEDGSFQLDEAQLREINRGNSIFSGEYTLNFIAKDKWGNEGEPVSLNFTFDRSSPRINNLSLIEDTGSDSNDSITADGNFRGRIIEENEIDSFKVGIKGNEPSSFIDFTNILNTNGGFTLGLSRLSRVNQGQPLADGDYTFSLIATDIAGNESTSEISYTLDTTAPEVTITEPNIDQILGDNSKLTGIVDEELASFTYRFNNDIERAIDLDETGAFDTILNLAELSSEEQTLTFTAIDLAGNVKTTSIEVKIDEAIIDNPPPEKVGEIEVFINSPSSIVADGIDEVTVTYTNTGDNEAIAPLLNLEAEGALLRSNDETEFSETEIQFLGISNNGQAGVLAPGETNSFTVEFLADGTTEEGINFSVSSINSNEVIDWESLRSNSRPDFITLNAWNEIYDNFLTEVGTTAGDYQQLLVDNANYLSELGDYEADADDLLAFEFQQASDYQAISQRDSLGSFGRGRTFIGDIELSVDDEGNVAIDNTGTRRSFTLLSDDTYQGQAGDFATLSLENGTYTLTEPDGTATVFNSAGQIDFIEDTNGNLLDAEYTEGLLTSLTDSFSNSLTFEYDDNSKIITVSDSDGRVTNYEYDEPGELLTAVIDEAGKTSYTYDGVALASITDPNGTTIEFAYDDRGRLSQQSISGENAATEVLNYSYGSDGEVSVTDAQGNETELLLNENGQVGQLTDANGRLINFSYDRQGNLTQIIAPENNSTLFGYDERGNLTAQVDANGNKTEFTYEEDFNQLTGFTDPRGNGISYSYDESGNLTTIEYTDGSKETFSYDDNGDVTVSTNRRGQEILYSYNDRGQIVSQINPDDSVPIEYTYDDRGNLDTVTDENGAIDLDYDNSDRLTKITYPNGRFLEYTYDSGDRRTSMTDSEGNTVNYGYDNAGRLASLTDGDGDVIVSYQYDEVGRLVREDKGNSTYTLYSYDLAGQLLDIENYAPDDSLNSSSIYTYDNLGRQTSLTTLDGSWTYEYDATGQLTGAEFVSTNPDIPNQNLTYEYDAAGNRIATSENGSSVVYTTNNLNQYTNVNGFDYQYDTDGNLVSQTTDEGTFLYSYNSENQLISVTSPDGTVTTYEYNPFGDRIATVVNGEKTEYLVDPFGFGDVVGEYDSNGNLVASYTHGLGLESISNTDSNYFYDFNATGSTVGLTNADGGIVNSYFYDPFGEDIAETEAVVNPFEFVGQYGVAEESNGLDYMRARFYDSDTGRFISPDPIGLNGGDTNLYRYVENNPISLVDPQGNVAFLPQLLIAIGNGIRLGINAIVGIGTRVTSVAVTPQGRGTIIGGLNVGAYEIDNYINFRDGTPGGYANAFLTGYIPGRTIPIGASQQYLFGKVPDSLILINFGVGVGAGSEELIDRVILNLDEPQDAYDVYLDNRFENLATPLFPQIGSPFFNDVFVSPLLTFEIDYLQDELNARIPETPNNQARSKGEPHLSTFDGVGYSFQGAGDFTLVESLDGDLNIQVRYVQIDNNVTVASAVATEVDGQNVVIDSEGIEFVPDPDNPDNLIPRVFRAGTGEALVTIDGEEVEIASGGSIEVGNSRIYRSSGGKYTIVYAGENGILEDGDDQLVVDYLRPGTINTVDVYLGDEKKGQITGLLGNLNDNPDDDIALRDGTVLPRPLRFDRLYGDYREEYRVKDISESLFTYEEGQNPDTFFNPNFPRAKFTYDDLSPELKAKGDAAALEAGYEPGTFAFESVAFDFAVTCDPGFLEGRETDPEAIGVDIIEDDGVSVGTGSISGIKFNDLNGNGIRDSELVQGANPDVVFVFDVSGSTGNIFQGTPINEDGSSSTIFEVELAAFKNLNQQLIAQGLGDKVDIGIVAFSGRGAQIDLDPLTEGLQLTATPNTDNNGNGIPDIEDVLSNNRNFFVNAGATGSTNYERALQTAEETFNTLGTQPGNGNLIFLSDGRDFGSSPEDEVARLKDIGVNLSAFGVGEIDERFLDNLKVIDPDAQIFTSTDEILNVFADLDSNTDNGSSQSTIEPTLSGVTIYLDLNNNGALDNGEPSQVTNENGEYSFTELEADTYIVREIIPDNSTQTTPGNGQFIIDLKESEIAEGFDFGNTLVEEEPNDLQIQLQAFLPNFNSPISEPLIREINDEVEYTQLPSFDLPGFSLVDVNIDLDFGTEAGTIFFEVDENERSGRFSSAEENTYVFTDISDSILPIENITIDESLNSLGLEDSDITFTDNRIEVNVESLAFAPGLNALLNVEFAKE